MQVCMDVYHVHTNHYIFSYSTFKMIFFEECTLRDKNIEDQILFFQCLLEDQKLFI
jgi:hypothetical protein